METHIQCDPEKIARYVFCPGDHARAGRIADHFEGKELVSTTRGYVVYTGSFEDVPMTTIGTGMGGPTVAIALEELAHMGAHTFIRVGSCGVFQEGQTVGDVIISTGSVREGGTGNHYLPVQFPAVPTFSVLRNLVDAAVALSIPITVGVGISTDVYYAPLPQSVKERRAEYVKAGIVSIEMESDTLYVMGAYRGWRTGAIFTSDGTPSEIKPDGSHEAYQQGEENMIRLTLRAMRSLAREDGM